jgi:anti-sigma regulatory factor (Ser/Thr protein kinase)
VDELTLRLHGPLGRSQVELLRLQLSQWLEGLGAPPREVYASMSVLDEFASNLMEHSGATWVELRVWPWDGRVHVSLRDDGKKFDAAVAVHKDYSEYLKGDTDRKLGLYMVGKLTEDLKYEREEPEGLNHLTFVFKFKTWKVPSAT